MSTKGKERLKGGLGLLAIAAIIAAVILGFIYWPTIASAISRWFPHTTASTASTTHHTHKPKSTSDSSEASKFKTPKHYDPTKDTIPAAALCTPTRMAEPWYAYSTPTVDPGNSDARNYTAAITRPYKATDDATARSETFEINCADMTELSQWYQDVATWPNALVAKGWVDAFNTTYGTAESLSSLYKLGPNGTPVVTAEGQKYAEYMNAFILQFRMDGLHAQASVRYWEMGPFDPRYVPTVQKAPGQDTKPSWLYTDYNKLGVCQFRFGVNPLGGELVVYTCTTPTPPSTTPHCTVNCGGRTCVQKYGWVYCHPPVCPTGWVRHYWSSINEWTCKSPASVGPGSNGNAGNGSGTSHDTGPGAPTPRETPTPTPTPTYPPKEGGEN